ncbi:MAG: hypothetical protein M5U09_25695 [Gammaproteobacteria bacterium]|nr:hypothetical protein [Gammaproteobacteria bacterium]
MHTSATSASPRPATGRVHVIPPPRSAWRWPTSRASAPRPRGFRRQPGGCVHRHGAGPGGVPQPRWRADTGHVRPRAGRRRRPYPALLVPDSAIATDQAPAHRLRRRRRQRRAALPVELGRQQGPLRVVRSGIDANDRVVINGLQRARPGQAVEPVDGTIAE